jgi:hypothetical protein
MGICLIRVQLAVSSCTAHLDVLEGAAAATKATTAGAATTCKLLTPPGSKVQRSTSAIMSVASSDTLSVEAHDWMQVHMTSAGELNQTAAGVSQLRSSPKLPPLPPNPLEPPPPANTSTQHDTISAPLQSPSRISCQPKLRG